jgi:ParB-like chromosome segregation protein Spo0J
MERVKSSRFETGVLRAWPKAELLLPEYTGKQYDDLAEFLAAGGQMPPIVIAEDYRIIDGYNRWRMAQRLGLKQVECDLYSYADEIEMEKHAIVLNSKRRHLDNIQVARAAARLSDLYQPTSPATEQQQAENAPGEESVMLNVELPVASAPAPMAPVHEDPPAPVSTRESAKLIKKVSEQLGVSPRIIKQVQRVDQTRDGKLIQAMESKAITLKKAAEIAELPEAQRQQMIEAECLKPVVTPAERSVTRLLDSCEASRKKLENARDKIQPQGLSDQQREEAIQSVNELIQEARQMLQHLQQPATEAEPAPPEPPPEDEF